MSAAHKNALPAIHPGEYLKEDHMSHLQISNIELASSLCIPVETLDDVLAGKSPVTAELAIRLARYFSTTPEFWLNIQQMYDLKKVTLSEVVSIRGQISPHPFCAGPSWSDPDGASQ